MNSRVEVARQEKSVGALLWLSAVMGTAMLTACGGGKSTPQTPPPVAPTVMITVSPAGVMTGQSATVTWSSTNATSCTASGAWSGTESTSGSQSVTPSAAGTYTYDLACSGAGGSASGSAALTVNAGLAVIGVSDSSPIPLAPLYISTSGINVGAPVTVQFADSSGFSVSEQSIRVAADGTVVAAVPLYVNPGTGQIGPGTVSMVLTQGTEASVPFALNIQDLPAVSSYGTQLGDISHAVLVMNAILLGRQINQLQAFQLLPQNTVDTSQAQATLSSSLNAVIQARNDIDRVSLDNTLVIGNGTLPDGTLVQFDSTSLDLMDRVGAVILNETLATVISGASSHHRLTPMPSVRPRTKNPLIPPGRLLPAHSLFGSPRKKKSMTGVGSPQSSQLNNLLDLMKTQTGVNDLASAAFDALNSNAGWVDYVQAAATASGVYLESLPETKNNQILGMAAGLVSNIQLIGTDLTDDAVYIGALVSGNQNLANAAVQDIQNIPVLKQWSALYAVVSLLAPYEQLAPVSTTLNYLTSFYDLGESALESAYSTGLNLTTQYSIPFPSGTQGIGTVVGSVNVPTDQGISAPLSGIDLSSNQDIFTTIADPSGTYELFVPLQSSAFDYANADVTIIDPLTQNTLGSAVIDLSGLTTENPLQVMPIQGNPCTDPGSPDGDDPDCD